MKYSCNLIKDLLPLYHDGVCSDDSNEIIEQHLSECPACKEYFEEMCKTDEVVLIPQDSDREIQKAASFRAVKKKLRQKQILMLVVFVVVLMTAFLTIVGVLKNSTDIVEYNDNISVSMVDGSLVGRLKGSQYDCLEIKQVTAVIDGEKQNCLFFCLSDTKWDDLTTSINVFSEYTLCSSDKSADEVNRVYYFTGDFSGIELMDDNELQNVILSSVLLWSK